MVVDCKVYSGAVIDFYYDPVSPYCYVGLEAILRYEHLLPAKLNLKPVSFVAIAKAVDNIIPRDNKAKFAYLLRDMKTLCAYWNLTLTHPADYDSTVFQRGGEKARRLLVAIEQYRPEFVRPAALEFARCVYVKDEPIYLDEHIRIVAKRIGLPEADKIIAASKTQETNNLLAAIQDEALDSGAYGAPWIVLKQKEQEDMVLFGGDRIPQLCHKLGVQFKGPHVNSKSMEA